MVGRSQVPSPPMGSPWEQQSYAVRLDWGLRGARELGAGGVQDMVVVDVLSCTT